MKKSSVLLSIVFLVGILTACSSNFPTPTPASDSNEIATVVAATLSAIPSAAIMPTSTDTPVVDDWVWHNIDLYSLKLNLPQGWVITELNRKPEPTNPGDPITGHDCAEYQINSFDNLSVLFLRPTCGFGEGFPGTYPPGTIVINPNSNNQKIGRYFNGTEYEYSDLILFSYSDLTGDHEETVCLEPPVIIIGDGLDFIAISTTFQYLGPQEQKEKILETVDMIILSITPVPPTSTSTPVQTFAPLYSEITWENLGTSEQEVVVNQQTNEKITLSGYSFQASMPSEKNDLTNNVYHYYSNENMASMGWILMGGGGGATGILTEFYSETGYFLTIRFTYGQSQSIILWISDETTIIPVLPAKSDY